MKGFAVTFETVTPESAEYGDAAERGYLGDGLTLRDALALFNAERDGGYPVEPDSLPVSAANPPRWLTDIGVQDYSGATRSVSLHIPESVTGSSAMRIARLVKCYGVS